MFALVEFQNGELFVTTCRNVRNGLLGTFSVKWKGIWYAAKVIIKSNDKSYLEDCKKNYKHLHLLLKISQTSLPMQLIPLINKNDILKYVDAKKSSTELLLPVSSLNGLCSLSTHYEKHFHEYKQKPKYGYIPKKLSPTAAMNLVPVVNKREILKYMDVKYACSSNCDSFSVSRPSILYPTKTTPPTDTSLLNSPKQPPERNDSSDLNCFKRLYVHGPASNSNSLSTSRSPVISPAKITSPNCSSVLNCSKRLSVHSPASNSNSFSASRSSVVSPGKTSPNCSSVLNCSKRLSVHGPASNSNSLSTSRSSVISPAKITSPNCSSVLNCSKRLSVHGPASNSNSLSTSRSPVISPAKITSPNCSSVLNCSKRLSVHSLTSDCNSFSASRSSVVSPGKTSPNCSSVLNCSKGLSVHSPTSDCNSFSASRSSVISPGKTSPNCSSVLNCSKRLSVHSPTSDCNSLSRSSVISPAKITSPNCSSVLNCSKRPSEPNDSLVLNSSKRLSVHSPASNSNLFSASRSSVISPGKTSPNCSSVLNCSKRLSVHGPASNSNSLSTSSSSVISPAKITSPNCSSVLNCSKRLSVHGPASNSNSLSTSRSPVISPAKITSPNCSSVLNCSKRLSVHSPTSDCNSFSASRSSVVSPGKTSPNCSSVLNCSKGLSVHSPTSDCNSFSASRSSVISPGKTSPNCSSVLNCSKRLSVHSPTSDCNSLSTSRSSVISPAKITSPNCSSVLNCSKRLSVHSPTSDCNSFSASRSSVISPGKTSPNCSSVLNCSKLPSEPNDSLVLNSSKRLSEHSPASNSNLFSASRSSVISPGKTSPNCSSVLNCSKRLSVHNPTSDCNSLSTSRSSVISPAKITSPNCSSVLNCSKRLSVHSPTSDCNSFSASQSSVISPGKTSPNCSSVLSSSKLPSEPNDSSVLNSSKRLSVHSPGNNYNSLSTSSDVSAAKTTPLNDSSVASSSKRVASSITLQSVVSVVNSTINHNERNLDSISMPTKTPLLKFSSTLIDFSENQDNYTSLSQSSVSKNILHSTKSSAFSISNENCSEYLPDATIDLTEENVSVDQTCQLETTFEVIKHPLKISNVEVQYKNSGSKTHFCMFCKTLHTKLSRHFSLKHPSEKEVKEFLNLPIKSKERTKIINDLRKKGDFMHNTTEDYNTGVLIVSRQQQSKGKKKTDDYICCKNCKGFFTKITLRSHLHRCGKKVKNSRHNVVNGRKLTQYIHAEANYTLRTKIFPVLRDDDVTKAIRYDDLVINFGNQLSEKYTLTHQHDMIRSKLRLLGRLLIEVKKLDETVDQLKHIYKPSKYKTCLEALRTVSNWDEEQIIFKTPAVAQSLSSLIKRCGRRQKSEYIKSGSEDAQKEVEKFLNLWEEEIPIIVNKKANEDHRSKALFQKPNLPTINDINKLYLYLKNKMLSEITILQNKYELNYWNGLIKSTLIFIQVFNRKRAGEIERLTINSYLNKEEMAGSIGSELLKTMSKEAVLLAKQFVRLTLRGKLGRTVSVLLCPLCITAIELILKYRCDAGIPPKNEFIFCKNVVSKFGKPYYRACPLLKQFAAECGAENPERLRGTTLRKHIATHTSFLDVQDTTVDQLANFMGHNKDIHKSIYRIPVSIAEITRVSKILLSAIGNDKENEEDFAENSESESEKSEKAACSSKRKRSTSPYGKTKRIKWNEKERDAITSAFGTIEKLGKLPSTSQCIDAIKANDALKKRTPQQIKSWIDNQRRYKLKVANSTSSPV